MAEENIEKPIEEEGYGGYGGYRGYKGTEGYGGYGGYGGIEEPRGEPGEPEGEEEEPEEEPERKEEPEGEAEEGEEEEAEEPEEETGGKIGALLSPEGVMMMLIAGILDFFSAICFILIFFFGVGLIPSKIIDAFGFIFIGILWPFFRSGTVALKGKSKHGKLKEMIEKGLGGVGGLLKKHWIKMAVKFVVGIFPGLTYTVYKELTS